MENWNERDDNMVHVLVQRYKYGALGEEIVAVRTRGVVVICFGACFRVSDQSARFSVYAFGRKTATVLLLRAIVVALDCLISLKASLIGTFAQPKDASGER